MNIQCKDCENTIEITGGPELIKAGWRFIMLTDDEEDIANGWRCPQCNSGWNEIMNHHGPTH